VQTTNLAIPQLPHSHNSPQTPEPGPHEWCMSHTESTKSGGSAMNNYINNVNSTTQGGEDVSQIGCEITATAKKCMTIARPHMQHA